ncbi:MAG: c-type cytochrome [Gammaproteobacteria bacterium]|nr:c-type cytochrome [Gammaproteobacteria bacterium]
MKSKILFIVFSLSSFATYANNDDVLIDAKKANAIAEGGRIYDKWWKELKLEKPETTHPAYPATAKKQGSASWRCKECHGWDYKGNQGAYSKGSHKTGIKGIRNAVTMSDKEIVAILKNKIHGYDKVMPEAALAQLANFVKNGQVDIARYLNKETLLANGNIKRGKIIFNNTCKECHGSDGRNINFKKPLNPEFLGTVATENPVETIHKFRNGNPNTFINGEPMPNMNKTLNLEEQIDLLTFLQTLPVK